MTLLVAGFGPEEKALRAQCRALGLEARVSFVGAISQAKLPELYRRAALFVAPFIQASSGDQEGLGLVALEASGCGCPVIISDMPATREVFVDRVPSGSSAALATAIIRQLEATPEARAALAASQRAKLAQMYDWSAVAGRYADLLELAARGSDEVALP